MDLYLIRHPRPAVAEGVCYGDSDLELAEPVEHAAERLRSLLPQGCAIYASPLKRARALAEALGDTVLDPRLREIHFGAWELRRFDELQQEMSAWAADPLGFRAPGGESAREMAQRVLTAWGEIEARHAGSAVAIVAHGGPLRAIAGSLLAIPAERWLALDFECGTLSHLELHPWGTRLRAFNR